MKSLGLFVEAVDCFFTFFLEVIAFIVTQILKLALALMLAIIGLLSAIIIGAVCYGAYQIIIGSLSSF